MKIAIYIILVVISSIIWDQKELAEMGGAVLFLTFLYILVDGSVDYFKNIIKKEKEEEPPF